MESTQERIESKQREHGRFRFFRDFGAGWRQGRTNDDMQPGTRRLLIGAAELAVVVAVILYVATRH